MPDPIERSSNFHRGTFCLACALAISSTGLGQERDSDAITDEDREGRNLAVGDWVPSARTWAKLLLENFDLVAVGEFSDIPDLKSDSASAEVDRLDARFAELLMPHEVVVTFNIRGLYKGASRGSTIKVELVSDMLLFPGEDVSRYSRRFRHWQELAAEKSAMAERLSELDESYQDGEMTLDEYERTRARLLSPDAERLAVDVNIPTRMVFITHGETFYDLGGAVGPGESYLVGLNWTPHDLQAYTLDERPHNGRSIFWGEMADDVIAALNEFVR
jgi:hypothetical protein